MRLFERINPAVTAAYFLAVTLLSSLCADGIMAAMSLLGAAAMFILLRMNIKLLALYAAAAAAFTLINALSVHNGKTVLFVLNDSPITLEAIVCGAASGVTVAAVMCWFAVFSRIMTEDKLLYVLGLLWPKLALTVSMALRSVPLYTRQYSRVSDAQRAIGAYREETLIDKACAGLHTFSAVVTWALENGIVTADSMTARGYGTGRRTSYALYDFRAPDALALAVTAVLAVVTAAGALSGAVGFEYYPSIVLPQGAAIYYSIYFVLVMLPCAAELAEESRWRYLRSKI